MDLDLLGVGQGVVQGLRLGLWYLTSGWRRAHHALCGETDHAQDQPADKPGARTAACLLCPEPKLPQRKGNSSFQDPNQHILVESTSLVLSVRQKRFLTCSEKESKELLFTNADDSHLII